MTNETYMTKKDAAEALGVSVKTVERWIARGILKAYRFGPRRVLISQTEVDNALTEIDPTSH